MFTVVLLVWAASIFGSCFNSACVFLATIWLLWRTYLIADKPLDELVHLLGFEIPQAPALDLAAVKADALTIHWTPADERKTAYKYLVHVNGSDVVEILQTDSCIVVGNLEPDRKYIVRIVVKSTAGFRTVSNPVRVRTKSASSGDFYRAPSHVASPIDPHPPRPNFQPNSITVRSFRTLEHSFAGTLAPTTSAPRESPMASQLTRRMAPVRKASPSIIPPQEPNSPDDSTQANNGEQTLKGLTTMLEDIAKDIDDLEKTLLEEEHESSATRVSLGKERDELRQILKERENASRDLRKQISALERENGTAQTKRLALVRLVQQKHDQSQKVKDDEARWEREIVEMRVSIEQYATSQKSLVEASAQQNQEHQARQAEESSAIRALEDEIKAKSIQLKKADQAYTEHVKDVQEQVAAEEKEQDRGFAAREAYLDEQYKAAYSEFEGAKRLCTEAYAQLQLVSEQHRHLSSMAAASVAAPSAIQRPLSRSASVQQQRHHNESPSTSGFGMAPASSVAGMRDASTDNRLYADPGVVADEPNTSRSTRSIRSGAGVSLLPSGLFNANEDDANRHLSTARDVLSSDRSSSNTRQDSLGGVIPGLGAFSGNGFLPGLGAAQVQRSDLYMSGSGSPMTTDSQSPSGINASPGPSSTQLTRHSPDVIPDSSDTRSIRSGRSLRNTSGPSGSRFSQILGLDKANRQRGKLSTDEGPALGSLSRDQTQSAPRPAATLGQDSPRNKRRNSNPTGYQPESSTNTAQTRPIDGGWGGMNPLTMMARNRKSHHPTSNSDDLSGPQQGLLQYSSIPRPGSSQSGEAMPLDGSSRNAWLGSDSVLQTRGSPLGKSWSTSVDRRHEPWRTRSPSRPASGQYSFGLADFEAELSSARNMPSQAPIGTKPAPIGTERSQSPPLNPAAQDFRSLFEFAGDKKEKPDKIRKRKESAMPQDLDSSSRPASVIISTNGSATATQTNVGNGQHLEATPYHGRSSRDTRSIATTDTGSGHSPRPSLDKTPSQTLSTPSSFAGSIERESFMQKLGRKSSSGKFGLPSFQREKSKRSGEDSPATETPGDATPPLRLNTDVTDDQEVKQRPKSGRSSARSWSAVFTSKIGKSKGRERNRYSMEVDQDLDD